MTNPYQAPISSSEGMMPVIVGTDREKVRCVARFQQWVLFALLANICANVLIMVVRAAGFEGTSQLLALVLLLPIIVFSMFVIFRLANELYGVVPAVLVAILMLVPCISLLTLLVVNGKATTFLQKEGVRVGFMGADPNRID